VLSYQQLKQYQGDSMEKHTALLPQRILCPIDFSDLSNLALKYAAIGAREFKAALSILHADTFDMPRYFSHNEDNVLLRQRHQAKQAVRKTIREHAGNILGSLADQLPLTFEVVEGHPIDAIMNVAENGQTDLIVLGTHGYSGLQRFLMGSVTENVVRNTKVPIFTVRQKTHDFIDSYNVNALPRIKRILCPCNLTATAAPALRLATSIARRFLSELTVLNCIDAEPGTVDTKKLNAWIADTIDDYADLKPEVCTGNPSEQIITHARTQHIDLIILGANHKPFMENTVMGKTTEMVLRQAPVPVLAVPHVIRS